VRCETALRVTNGLALGMGVGVGVLDDPARTLTDDSVGSDQDRPMELVAPARRKLTHRLGGLEPPSARVL
jgi:hypothetical protein